MRPRIFQTGRAAFTLVELMVAIAIVGVISVLVYQLFDVTSQNFREVDQLAEVNDRLRFATERVRAQIAGAGSLGTPDSDRDAWVAPAPAPGIRIAGLIPYQNWQNQATAAEIDPAIAAANPNVSFDGIIVAGAYDHPLAFELAGFEDQGGGVREGRIYGHYRGAEKLLRTDPFIYGIQELENLDDGVRDRLGNNNWTTRLIRVSDRQGYMQFVWPDAPLLSPVGPDGTVDEYLVVPLPDDGDPFSAQFKGPPPLDIFGLDNLPEGDTGYDAGLIDFFWIHAMPDPANPKIVTLVRDRLCGNIVAANALSGAPFNPNTALSTPANCGGAPERVVLASYVADFQIWFDCADANGAIVGADWFFEWDPNQHNTGDCMDDSAPEPGLARAAHIRIALHTRSERKEQRHIQFEDGLGAVCDPDDPTDCVVARLAGSTLRTFDFYPDSVGATQVAIMQSDFELVNFVNRNPL